MAEHDTKQPVIQPPEDFRGRPKAPEHEEEDTPRSAAPGKQARAIDPSERTPGAILDELPDGDGPRSDAGTNPLPDTYWDSYPDSDKPDRS
ncbi:hypothetical protein [Pyxidicoccus xibeiensis]|uniref:hypothetical protein n=1 Tax=Pyxidicoccus xibeiensis TaxID=2906759 RepID=UPI0020A7ECD8|nr:hypothetical protein [Pyxidicoccus xibeiensis]MCP3137268.1 hypothetical protein [Pyxidicoccus xibeiensis]